jgi:hypothetical protein
MGNISRAYDGAQEHKFHYRRVPRGCNNSSYDSVCRSCCAPIGHYCISKRTGRPSLFPHRSRKPAPRKIEAAVFREPLPDLSNWWRKMRCYEGQFALPRPANLVIP